MPEMITDLSDAELDVVGAGTYSPTQFTFVWQANQQNLAAQNSTQASVNLLPILSNSGNQASVQQISQGNFIGNA